MSSAREDARACYVGAAVARYGDFEAAYLDLPRELALEVALARAAGPVRRVLDVGCGRGSGLAYLRRRLPAAQLVGVDPEPEMLEAARLALGEAVRLERGTAEALPEFDAPFDLVVSYSNLRLWTDPAAGLASLHAALAPDGMAYVVDLNGDLPPEVRQRALSAIADEEHRALFSAQLAAARPLAEVERFLDEAGIRSYMLIPHTPSPRLSPLRHRRGGGSRDALSGRLASRGLSADLARIAFHLAIYP